MTIITLSGGNASTGFELHFWGAAAIGGVLADDATVASGNSAQVTFNNGIVTLIANGSFALGPDNYPTSGTITSFVYTWSPDGVPVTLTASGFSLAVSTLYSWMNAPNGAELMENFLLGGADTITGSNAPETLRGYTGNDTMSGGGGDDQIYVYFGDGHDIIDGGSGYDYLRLEFGSLFFPSPALNYVFDIPGMTSSTGVTLADGTTIRNVEAPHITAAGGNDTFIVGAQVVFDFMPWLDGHDGVDTLQCDFTGSNTAIANTPWSPGLSGSFMGYTIMNIELYNLTGGSGDDLLVGADLADSLNGGDGSDRIQGTGGNDIINGGAGADISQYEYQRSDVSWHRNLDGTWTVVTPGGTDTLTNIETLRFGLGPDAHLERPGSNFSTDGVSDFFLRNTTTGGAVMWFNASSSNAAYLGAISTSYVNEGFGDFNGDGRDDILWRNSTTGDIASWFMNNQTIAGSAGFGLGVSWDIAGIGDINGDTRDDLVLRNGSGDIVLWFMNGASITGASMGNVSTAWQIEVLGDFNGDGRDDFIWRNGTTGDMSMWLMDGTSVTPNNFANVGGAWTIAGVGDLNGDGRDDVVWRNGTTGDTALWFMNGGTIASQSGLNVATNFIIADVADFNGDGRDDIMWRSTTTNDVFAWYMNGGVVQGSAYVGNLGADWLINPGG